MTRKNIDPRLDPHQGREQLDDCLIPWPTPERGSTVLEGSADDGDIVGACMWIGIPTLGFWVSVFIWGWLWPIVALGCGSLLLTGWVLAKDKGWKLPRFFSRRSSSRRR